VKVLYERCKEIKTLLKKLVSELSATKVSIGILQKEIRRTKVGIEMSQTGK
jgi:hypothetical protein